jgi:mannose-6-phosphate isomerase-like protein (cupin superfamily)
MSSGPSHNERALSTNRRRAFSSVDAVPPIARAREHGGEGPIAFRRIFDSSDFASAIDFVDYTRIPPGSTIGRHEHHDNEEIYFVVAGTPLMKVDDEVSRLAPGSFSVVRSGGWHELVNDTSEDTEILVIQVGQRGAR